MEEKWEMGKSNVVIGVKGVNIENIERKNHNTFSQCKKLLSAFLPKLGRKKFLQMLLY